MFKRKHMFMAVKTITITEDAYSKLASNKKEGESFSELINRSFAKKGSWEAISRFVGAWEHIPDKMIGDLKKDIEKMRKTSGKHRMKEALRHLG